MHMRRSASGGVEFLDEPAFRFEILGEEIVVSVYIITN
jgi:hypothetical protein